MKTLYRTLMIIGLLLAALICYGYGFSSGTVIFVMLGMVLELGFWLGLFSNKLLPKS
ncbi:hypothetical protein [Alishewanella sp. HL-SH05]|uniref:hypothetical protein n=1 Tax=Alishewanella sp. HL-SH05 TaxID=3461145 RepID=UPI004041F8F7